MRESVRPRGKQRWTYYAEVGSENARKKNSQDIEKRMSGGVEGPLGLSSGPPEGIKQQRGRNKFVFQSIE